MKMRPYLILNGCLCLLLPLVVLGQDSVCAKVKMVIEQQLTLERQAFQAKMTISNGLPSDLENIDITVWVRPVTDNAMRLLQGTTDGLEVYEQEDGVDIFFVRGPENSPNGDSNDSLSSLGEVEYEYLLIPTSEAAGENIDGMSYEVGADLTYSVDGRETFVEVSPDSILVKPLPELTLEYFLPRSVIADDPFTSFVEPSEPFPLALRVINSGIGNAENVQIESFQPKLEDNDQGLLIDFEILGSRVNGNEVSPQLTVNFGQILAGHAEMADWLMISSLHGYFYEAKASVTHSDELGGSVTSIISSATVYRYVGSVRANADSIPDFLSVGSGSSDGISNRADFQIDLTNGGDAGFLRLHPSGLMVSDGSLVSTQDVLNLSPCSDLSGSSSAYSLSFDNCVTGGSYAYVYTRVNDPHFGRREINSVVRSDGYRLPKQNYWLQTEIKNDEYGGIEGYQYYVDVFDVGNGDAALSYVINYGNPIVSNTPPFFAAMSDVILKEGEPLSLTLKATDPDGPNTFPEFSSSILPSGASLSPTIGADGAGTASFEWPAASTLNAEGNYEISFVATDGIANVSRLLNVQVIPSGSSGLSSWLERFFGDDPSLHPSLNSDTDRDGLSLLLEYALNLNPLEKSTDNLPVAELYQENGIDYLSLLCSVRDDPELVYSAVVADDSSGQASWNSVGVIEIAEDSSDLPNGMQRLRWRDGVALSDYPENGRRFIRLKVDYVPSPQ